MLTLVVGYLILAIAVISSVNFAIAWIRRAHNEQAFNNARLQLVEHQIQQIIKAQACQVSKNKAAWQGLRKFKVTEIVQENEDIKSYYLKPLDKLPLAKFLPGQYLTLSLKLPNKDQPVIRCYSLSSRPAEFDHYRLSIKRIKATQERSAGLISNYMHEQLHIDQVLDAKMPAGHFFYDLRAPKPSVLVAGGIGITPVYSMFCAIARLTDPPQTWLFYSVRNQEDEIFTQSIREMASRHDNLHFIVCHSGQSKPEQCDYNEHISVALFKRVLPASNYQYYICGPATMMTQLTEALYDWGVPQEDVHFEAFGPASLKSSNQAGASSAVDADIQYDIILTRSDKKLQWNSSKGTLLEFLESENIPIDSSCRAGNCGSCALDLHTGKVKYDTTPGASMSNNQCLTCIAKPDSNLIIDA